MYYSRITTLLENISNKEPELKEITEWVQEISSILSSNGCEGELVNEIKKHLENTEELANTILKYLQTSSNQIETNAKNCDKVWASCPVGKTNGRPNDKKIISREETTNGIKLTIEEVTDVSYWTGREKKETKTKNISDDEMVQGKEFTF